MKEKYYKNMIYTIGNLTFEDEAELAIYKKSSRTMQEAADELETSKSKLFSFLRKHNLIVNKKVSPEFLAIGYFEEKDYMLSNGSFQKSVNLISVTPKGMVALKKLTKLLNPTFL